MTQTQTAVGAPADTAMADARPLGAQLMLGSAALLVLGSFLPWAKVSLGSVGSQTVSGMDGDGAITLAMAVAIGIFGWLHIAKGWSRGRLIGAISCASIATVTTLVDLKDVSRLAGAGIDGFGIDVSVGIGLLLAALASAIALAGGIMALRAKPGA